MTGFRPACAGMTGFRCIPYLPLENLHDCEVKNNPNNLPIHPPLRQQNTLEKFYAKTYKQIFVFENNLTLLYSAILLIKLMIIVMFLLFRLPGIHLLADRTKENC